MKRGSALGRTIARSALKLAPFVGLFAAGTAEANDIGVTDAWTAPNAEIGSDAVLGMVVTNDGAESDALVHVACPIANFSEKRQIDIGEGGKSAREVHDIPIAPKSKAILNRDGFHVSLLRIRQTLNEGDEFQCSVSFRQAGTIQVEVRVLQKAPTPYGGQRIRQHFLAQYRNVGYHFGYREADQIAAAQWGALICEYMRSSAWARRRRLLPTYVYIHHSVNRRATSRSE